MKVGDSMCRAGELGAAARKDGEEHEMPTHHNLDRSLEDYTTAAGIAQNRKRPLVRTTPGRSASLPAILYSSRMGGE